MKSAQLREEILKLSKDYFEQTWPEKEFIPGESRIPVSGRVFDQEDLETLLDASLDFWLTAGRYANQFETEFANTVGTRYSLLVNSGSSANLVALSTLTSPKLKEKKLNPGDEVITVAAGFPTTVNPIYQNQLTPVYLDIELGTYNIDVALLEEAVTENTKAIMLAHTLGNPFNLDVVASIAAKYNLWLIEDNCDALGAKYNGENTGTFGDIGTASFYPAHHITMGEGGAVFMDRPILKTIAESFRDWGRDCWCAPGADNTCGKRFEWQLGELPYGYDHKYIYSHIGYNLKVSDMQAAVGVSQLKKMSSFIETRKRNWQLLKEGLKKYEEFLILPEPTENSDPSWFGFLITVKEDAPFTRNDLTLFLEENKIATRLLFAGNIIRQPAYHGLPYRIVGDLKNTDRVMNQTFWVGVYPGITPDMVAYMIERFDKFLERF